MKINFIFKWASMFILFICPLYGSSQQQNPERKGKYVPGRNKTPKLQPDGTLSRSVSIKLEEKQKYNQVEVLVSPQTLFKQFIFAIQGVEQFNLNLPVTQQVALNFYTYMIQGNTYKRPTNIQNEPPIKVYVYENNNRIVYQQAFYFQHYIVFEGQQLSTYTIRFINSGKQKLIIMNVKKLTEASHVEQKVSKQSVQKYSEKASIMFEQFKFLSNSFQRYKMINFQFAKTIVENIRIYYYWQIAQTILALIVCAIQVGLIKKMCRQGSIV